MRRFILWLRPCSLFAVASAAAVSSAALAQAHYYNLDGGRPMRVEDAAAASRYSLDFDLAPFGIERLTGGTMRYRAEPKVSYGILPFTEIELRIPIVRVTPPRASGSPSVSGAAGAALGALRSFNLETTHLPAVAIGGEVGLPVGSLAPARTSYLAKILMTKTTGVARFHVNAGLGTYAVKGAVAGDTSCINNAISSLRILRAGDTCSNIPIIVDTPCDVRPGSGSGGGPSALAMCMATGGLTASSSARPSAALSQPSTFGSRWFAGLGFDHAFPLSSSLLTADIFAEKFNRLYPAVDWTAEAGIRHQVTPALVIDGGAGWHFAGTVRSTMLVVGAVYEFATPPLLGR